MFCLRYARWICLALAFLTVRQLRGQTPPLPGQLYEPTRTPAAVSPDSSDPLIRKAESFLRSSDVAQAESPVRQYLVQHPDSAAGHFLLGYILFRLAQAKDSLAEYTEGAKYDRPSAFDLKVVACDYVLLNDFSDADKWFTKVVEWTPKDVQAWYYLGRAKYNENRFEEAVSAFLQALQLDPNHEKAEDNLGLSYAGLNRIEEAIAAHKRAISLQSLAGAAPDPQPYLNLGTLLVDNDHPAEALPYLQDAARLAPLNSKIHKELGTAYLHLNQFDKAQSAFTRAVECAPSDASLHYMLAQTYRKLGLEEKAKLETARYAALKSAP